jgi:UDP-N-acetylglucosamine 4,6-dehydratase
MGNKRVLIIGGTGSLGQTLLAEMSHENEMFVVSRDENKQWSMKATFPACKFFLGDMRDCARMLEIFNFVKPHTVIIAAALKHIDQCEENPSECIKTNVNGVQNVINACIAVPPETVVFVSTDKACLPINTYGMSKALGEKITIHAGNAATNTKFIGVRYGNVLMSRGSIFPKLLDLCRTVGTKNLPLTDPAMTRFFMTLQEAVCLIKTAIDHGVSGDVWIPKITSFNIGEVFEWFSNKFKIPVDIKGQRPGEKTHEVLISESETYKTVLHQIDGKHYYVIKPYPVQIRSIFAEFSSSNSLGLDFERLIDAHI